MLLFNKKLANDCAKVMSSLDFVVISQRSHRLPLIMSRDEQRSEFDVTLLHAPP